MNSDNNKERKAPAQIVLGGEVAKMVWRVHILPLVKDNSLSTWKIADMLGVSAMTISRWRRFYICFILLLLMSCGGPGPSIEAERAKFLAGKPIVVGVIGNSISCGSDANGWRKYRTYDGPWVTQAGQDNPRFGAWTNQLQVWLRKKNHNSYVWNMSAGGFATFDHLINKTAERMASMNPKPSIVFLPLQINDSRFKVPLQTFEKNTLKIIRQLKVNGICVVLVKEIREPEGQLSQFDQYLKVIDTLSISEHLEVIDTFKGYDIPTMTDKEDKDYTHPNQAGHDFILGKYKSWFMAPSNVKP